MVKIRKTKEEKKSLKKHQSKIRAKHRTEELKKHSYKRKRKKTNLIFRFLG